MGCSFAWQRAENRTFVLLSCFYQQCTNIVLVLVSTSHLICISALFFFWKQRKSFDLIWLRWHTVRFLEEKTVLQFCLFVAWTPLNCDIEEDMFLSCNVRQTSEHEERRQSICNRGTHFRVTAGSSPIFISVQSRELGQ